MKTSIMLLTLLFTYVFANAQGLDSNANYIKTNYSSGYENTIKKHSLEKWDDDYSMVVYEINKQADALIKLIDSFKSKNTNIAFKAIQKWSFDGYKTENISKFRKIKSFGLEQLIKLHCDWSMVKYEYDKQVKAKNAF